MLTDRVRPLRALLALSAAIAAMSCGSQPAAPSNNPVVSGVAPSDGPTFGGTAITITGSNFKAGSTVAVGSAPATDVVVKDSTTITATTPAHASGAADILVRSADGGAGTLTRGFTYVIPTIDSSSPVIQSLVARGSRANEPVGYASVDETITVVATVITPATPGAKVTYDWSADAGSFSGSGSTVSWQAPHAAAQPVLRLTITETYQVPDTNGLPVSRINAVTSAVSVDVHDELGEVGAMAREFLMLFSQSSVSPLTVVHNFKDGCGAGGTGKADEQAQTANNRQNYVIVDYTVGPAQVTASFQGRSPYRLRAADAWAVVPTRWVSQCLLPNVGCSAVGLTRTDQGNDWVTAMYDPPTKRWWLCDSDWEGQLSTTNALGRTYLK